MPEKKSLVDSNLKKYNKAAGDWFVQFEAWQDNKKTIAEYDYAYYLCDKLITREAKSNQRKQKALAEKLAKSLGFELKAKPPELTLEQLKQVASTHNMTLVAIDSE
jgi:hypothetical protein